MQQGFSKSIIMAFAARALDGFFCGNMVVLPAASVC